MKSRDTGLQDIVLLPWSHPAGAVSGTAEEVGGPDGNAAPETRSKEDAPQQP
ncbi:TPA: hypothetical protein HA251_08005 [Candidatus Woesearchaeota archaeon]|nr:hypothetical protein [Candidatus Woesearchaeota archaeon]